MLATGYKYFFYVNLAGFNFKGYPVICGGHAAIPTATYDIRCFQLNKTSWVQVDLNIPLTYSCLGSLAGETRFSPRFL